MVSPDESFGSLQIQPALADTTERYRSLFDYNPHAVFSLDLAGRFEASNSASEHICGYSLDELSRARDGCPDRSESCPGDAAAFAKALNRESTQLETALIHKDGHSSR